MPDVLTESEAQVIEDALNQPREDEAAILTAVESEVGSELDPSTRNKVTAALRLLGNTSEVAVQGLVKKLSGILPVEKTETTKPSVEESKVELPAEVIELAKSGDYEAITKAASASPGVVGLVVELLKSRDAEIKKANEFMATMIAKADDDAVRKIVEDAGLPGMSTDDQIKLVKSMNPEARSSWASHAKALRANIALSDVERGTPRRGSDSYNPYDEINKRVSELVSKSDGKLSEFDAQMQVLQADPKLASDYREYVRGGNV